MNVPAISGFKQVVPEDKAVFEKFLARRPSMSCEYSFLNLYCWQDSCGTRWHEYQDRLLVWYEKQNLMLMPMGKFFSPAELSEIRCSFRDQDRDIAFYDVPEEYLKIYPEVEDFFDIEFSEDYCDYIHCTEKLKNLKGKKLRKKRNLIKQFVEEYPDYDLKPLSNSLKDECLDFALQFNAELEIDMTADESMAMKRAFSVIDTLDATGLVLLHNSRIIGFSIIGHLIDDICCEHFEKASHEYKGASQLLNNEIARSSTGKYKYINREQDLGLPGLRHAKHSYDPDIILKRYSLTGRS